MSHPYLPLYVDDYDAATAHLTPAEDGAYGRLLRLCWRTPGCSLPNDDAWIARKIRMSPAEFLKVAKPVIDEFFRLQRGRLVQKRLKAEYEDISRKKSARVKAGKKGGEAKALKNNENDPSNASVLLGDTRAFPYPYPEPDTQKEDELLSVTRTGGFDFDGWWKIYPGAVAKPKARQAYVAALAKIGGPDPDAVLRDGLVRSIASARWNDPTHTKPNPARWLEEERWTDRDDTPDQPAARIAAIWPGPAEIRTAVVGECGEAFAASYLDPARWNDAGEVVAATGYAAEKLRAMKALTGIRVIVRPATTPAQDAA